MVNGQTTSTGEQRGLLSASEVRRPNASFIVISSQFSSRFFFKWRLLWGNTAQVRLQPCKLKHGARITEKANDFLHDLKNKDLNYGELRPRVSRETNLRTRCIFRRDVNNSLRNSKPTKLEPLVEIHPNFPYFMTSRAKRYQRKNYRRNSVFDSSFELLFLIQVFF